MLDLGTVQPGSTIYVPFNTFDSNDPSASVTITGLAATDIEIYKDGGTTQRASDAGYTLLDTDGIDFDSITGIHGFSVDLSNNTTANFYEAGSDYFIVVSSITVDAATINFLAARFRIGYPGAILDTTIATLSSQTSFTLEDGSADNDAYIGCPVYIHDLASAVQVAFGYVSDYVGSTKTITLAADPGIFTMAAGDNISFFPPANVQAVAGTTQTAGNLASLITTVDTVVDGIQTDLDNGTDGLGAIKSTADAIETDTQNIQSRLPSALVGGKMDSDATSISGDSTAADNLEAMYDGTGYTDDTAPASRSQVSNIGSSSGGSLNFANEADNVDSAIKTISFDGVETSGTNASTNFEDATYHQIDDTTNNIDIVYQFDIGGGRTAVELLWKGRLVGTNDQMLVKAYNGSTWDTVKTVDGHSNSAPSVVGDNATENIPLLTTHTGTGSDLGKVFIRLECVSQSNPTIYTDQLLVTAVNIGQSVGYANGAIWIDTNNGTAGTESFVNGTADNPVDSIADAITISGNIGITRFHIAAGSSITLAATAENYEFMGQNWTLAFGGQTITGAKIAGATLSGTFVGSTAILEDCIINAITGPGITMRRCFFNEVTMTNNGTAGWFLNDCRSRVAGTGRATFDFGVGVGNTGLSMRNWSGGIELENMGDTGTDNASIEGFGNIVLNANCDGGTLARRGVFDFTDNSGNVTIVEDEITEEVGNILVDTGTTLDGKIDTIDGIVDAILVDTGTTLDGKIDTIDGIVDSILVDTGTTLDAKIDTIDGIVDAILVDTGTTLQAELDGIQADTEDIQSRLPAALVSGKMDSDMTAISGSTSAADNLELSTGQIISGACEGTPTTTSIQTDLAESSDDIYIGRTVIFTSGAAQDEATDITDYVGATGTLTVTALSNAPSASDTFIII